MLTCFNDCQYMEEPNNSQIYKVITAEEFDILMRCSKSIRKSTLTLINELVSDYEREKEMKKYF